MKIQKFSFSHHRENWHIDEVSFDDFNLLVGPSGVGKTRILKALELIFSVALGKEKLDDFEWDFYFSCLEKNYSWYLKSKVLKNQDSREFETAQFEIFEELLSETDQAISTEVFHVTSSISKLNNQKLPKIKKTESIFSLFPEESTISIVLEELRKIVPSKIINSSTYETINDVYLVISLLTTEPIQEVITKIESLKNQESFVETKEIYCQVKNLLATVQNEVMRLCLTSPPTLRLAVLFHFYSEIIPFLSDLGLEEPDFVYQKIQENYLEIFPEIKDIKINVERLSGNSTSYYLEIQDTESGEWIPQDRMSSGMFRTLIYIIEVMTAPKGSIILIDEFENSLGINCMAELTEFILDHVEGIQFIITSHHPYIINNIPWQDWQIVSRKGNHIRTTKATEIQALDTASSLDKFTQLINVLEFEDIAT